MASTREILRASLLGLLKPIVRFALQHSFKLRDLLECIKIVFVTVAKEELEQLGEPITTSKLSVMTGIQRKELARLLEDTPIIRRDQDLTARVIGLWQSAKRFCDASGRPRVLSFVGRDGEFADLVAEVSSDLNPYTIAFELERAGIAKNNGKGLQLVLTGYQPKGNLKESLLLLETDQDYLMKAVHENIFQPVEPLNLHIKTEYDNIPAKHWREIREWFLQKGDALHKEARKYLSQLDRDITVNRDSSDKKTIRAVLGTFSLTEDLKK